MKTLIISIAVCLLAASPSLYAQNSRGHSPNVPRPVEGGTPIPFSAGTVISSVTDKNIVLRMADGETRNFRLAARPVYIAADGSAVESPTLAAGTRVLFHTMEEGNVVLIDRIFIQK